MLIGHYRETSKRISHFKKLYHLHYKITWRWAMKWHSLILTCKDHRYQFCDNLVSNKNSFCCCLSTYLRTSIFKFKFSPTVRISLNECNQTNRSNVLRATYRHVCCSQVHTYPPTTTTAREQTINFLSKTVWTNECVSECVNEWVFRWCHISSNLICDI